jgi:septum formation protein
MVAEHIPPTPVARLILASGSPRRRTLLTMAGFVFDVERPDVAEIAHPGEAPEQMAMRLAGEKALAVAERYDSHAAVLGCDTIVVLDDAVLGKPVSEADAAEMLLALAGRSHTVITGFALKTPGTTELESGAAYSEVMMRPVAKAEAAAYAATGEPLDKAGAYALQGDGGRFVERVDGSRSNVIGLPLEAVVPLLARHGITGRRGS